MLKLRNPWGNFEWNGDWSDSSNLWTPETRKMYRVEESDDGIFWMSFEDFCKNLTSVGICKVEGDNLYNFIEIKEPKGT